MKPMKIMTCGLCRADDEMQFDPNSFMQTMQKMFGK